jgi:hypothetical protein
MKSLTWSEIKVREKNIIMGLLFKKYKTKFRYTLQPLFALLLHKRKQMEGALWLDLCYKTKQSIMNNPFEFLGPDLPEKNLMEDILEEIFFEFIKERASKDAIASINH